MFPSFVFSFPSAELISKRLKKFVAREEWAASIDRELDLDLIRQMIVNEAFDTQSFMQVFEAIWERIARVQAPAQDEAWLGWKQEIYGAIALPDCTWHTLLPALFNRLLCQLDIIEDAVVQVQAAAAVTNATTPSSSSYASSSTSSS